MLKHSIKKEDRIWKLNSKLKNKYEIISSKKMPKPERGEAGPKKYVFDFDGSLLVSK